MYTNRQTHAPSAPASPAPLRPHAATPSPLSAPASPATTHVDCYPNPTLTSKAFRQIQGISGCARPLKPDTGWTQDPDPPFHPAESPCPLPPCATRAAIPNARAVLPVLPNIQLTQHSLAPTPPPATCPPANGQELTAISFFPYRLLPENTTCPPHRISPPPLTTDPPTADSSLCSPLRRFAPPQWSRCPHRRLGAGERRPPPRPSRHPALRAHRLLPLRALRALRGGFPAPTAARSVRLRSRPRNTCHGLPRFARVLSPGPTWRARGRSGALEWLTANS